MISRREHISGITAPPRNRKERALKLWLAIFAIAAVVAAGGAVFFAAAHRNAAADAVHWQNAAKAKNLEVLAADEVTAELRQRLADDKADIEELKSQLDRQEMAYSRDLERLAGIDDQLEAAHVRSVAELLRHIEVHHAEIRILKHREGWLRRDLVAATCYVTQECDPTRVGFGGLD